MKEVRSSFLNQQLHLFVEDREQLYLLWICLKRSSYLVDIVSARLRIAPGNALKVSIVMIYALPYIWIEENPQTGHLD